MGYGLENRSPAGERFSESRIYYTTNSTQIKKLPIAREFFYFPKAKL